MSESIITQRGHMDFRRQLLAGTSAFALISFACTWNVARAEEDADRPTLWIELGAQFEQVNGFGGPFSPHFTSEVIADGFESPLQLQHALSQSFGEESTISFQPENSDWIFSASLRYGRANGGANTHEQTPGCRPCKIHLGTYYEYHSSTGAKFSETRATNHEAHTILDFQVGKDIGLGLFGSRSKSIFGAGMRFAQFTSRQALGMNASPDFYAPTNLKYSNFHHTYVVTSHMERSFRGMGPSLSWNASAPIIGGTDQGALALDWGVSASLLFGRQKAKGYHQTVGTFYKTNKLHKYHFTSHIHRSGSPDRSRAVTVPNVGGFAGVSYAFPNARLSVGYRADLFFGAMDGGIDTAKKENVGFYGPFARVSVGLGG